MSEKRLNGRITKLEDTLKEILHYCNHLHNDCKYNLNDGHIRKIRNICRRELGNKCTELDEETSLYNIFVDKEDLTNEMSQM